MATVLSLRQLEDHQRALPPGHLASTPEKPPKTFGRIAVSADALRDRLGPVTWRVWWHAEQVCGRRDGRYFEGRERAAEELKLSPRAVKKAITRLVKAGLVELGSRHKLNDGHWFYPKTVRGHFAQGPNGPVVLVPPATHLWLQRPEKRGGRRPGAGRPIKGLAKSNRGPPSPPRNSNRGPPKSNRGPSSNTSGSETTFVLPYGSTAADAAHLPVASTSPLTGFSPPATGAQEVSGQTGLGLRGKMRGGGPPPPGQGGVPRFPGPTLLVPLTVPGPREIPADLGDEDAVEWMLKMYRGAVEKKTGKRCWVFPKKGDARKSKHWPKLKQAMELFREYRWAPGTWVQWMFATWFTDGRRKTPPNTGYVFNPTYMMERSGWFEAEQASYQATRLVYNDIAKAILARYRKMQEELVSTGARSEEAVRSVVEKHWPNGLYEKALMRANTRTRSDQATVAQKLLSGDWLW